jgi:acetyl-CoA carboxylase biotin carboxyl carrier protein
MNIKEIKSLVEIMESNSLNVLEVTEGETKIRMERHDSKESPIKVTEPLPSILEKTIEISENKKIDNLFEVKSPMVGVFYRSPAPGSEPFVKVGSKVKKGDVLCVVEAMKLMNEICAEKDGIINEICAEDGQVIEFSHVLFRLS